MSGKIGGPILLKDITEMVFLCRGWIDIRCIDKVNNRTLYFKIAGYEWQNDFTAAFML